MGRGLRRDPQDGSTIAKFRCRESELDRWREAAKSEGLSFSDFARACLDYLSEPGRRHWATSGVTPSTSTSDDEKRALQLLVKAVKLAEKEGRGGE